MAMAMLTPNETPGRVMGSNCRRSRRTSTPTSSPNVGLQRRPARVVGRERGQQLHVRLDVPAQPAGAANRALVGDQERHRRRHRHLPEAAHAGNGGSSEGMKSPHYAEAFSPLPGRCFRLVARHGGQAGPAHCPEPPVWRGTFRAKGGRRYTVEACEGHRPEGDR
jgi:hypothetical protein